MWTTNEAIFFYIVLVNVVADDYEFCVLLFFASSVCIVVNGCFIFILEKTSSSLCCVVAALHKATHWLWSVNWKSFSFSSTKLKKKITYKTTANETTANEKNNHIQFMNEEDEAVE